MTHCYMTLQVQQLIHHSESMPNALSAILHDLRSHRLEILIKLHSVHLDFTLICELINCHQHDSGSNYITSTCRSDGRKNTLAESTAGKLGGINVDWKDAGHRSRC